MKIAIMQPYTFPYIGYFQMIKAVDKFVFYDDVNFIKRGWINRNQILSNDEKQFFTIPLIKASQNKLINEIQINIESKEYSKLTTKIQQTYNKAPYFKQVFPVLEEIFNKKTVLISDFAINSVIKICQYLEINTEFLISSKCSSNTKGMDRADRLIEICKGEKCNDYINAIGGVELYDKEYFKKNGINLEFIKPNDIIYKQFTNFFVPWLSIIDVLMFNDVEKIHKLLNEYQIV